MISDRWKSRFKALLLVFLASMGASSCRGSSVHVKVFLYPDGVPGLEMGKHWTVLGQVITSTNDSGSFFSEQRKSIKILILDVDEKVVYEKTISCECKGIQPEIKFVDENNASILIEEVVIDENLKRHVVSEIFSADVEF